MTRLYYKYMVLYKKNHIFGYKKNYNANIIKLVKKKPQCKKKLNNKDNSNTERYIYKYTEK